MHLRAVAVISLIALACGARPQPAAAPAPVPAPASGGPVFIVPRDGAIAEVDAEGRLLRTIARVPAQDLWPLPGGALLAYDASTLRRVRPGGQVDLTVALPATGACADSDVDASLFPQRGLRVDRQGRAASATMAELEYDAEFNVEVTVCLDTGRVHADPGTILDGCTLTPAPSLDPPPCLSGAEPTAPSENQDERLPDLHAHRYGFDVQDGNVVRREGDRVTVAGGPLLAYDGTAVSAISPSGRWLLLQGPELTASSVYYYWLLFDRRTGDVYPLPDQTTARWPAPMGPRAFAAPDDELRSLSYTARPFRWVPGGEDLFQVNQLLIYPGERVIDLGGRPAHED